MKLRFSCFCLVALLLGIFGCQPASTRHGMNKPIDLRAKIQMACFEVVIKKPEKDSLVYEKELPLNLIDFNIRNDPYLPLGTAFAVSKTELVTAAHVLQLIDYSPFLHDMYIRDANGSVYPIDTLLSFHSARDFVKFTVKDKTFESWFTLRREYTINENVLAVGNIYGEGLVSIPGTLLGTLPEPENGRWLYLKSSPPNDLGSSGGPLLDQNGNVIGVIVSKNDNFSYSLPVSEIEKTAKNTGVFHKVFTYGFNFFPERIEAASFDREVALPAYYRDVKQEINNSFSEQYRINMDRLFSINRDNIFPNGKSSLISLNEACNAEDIQVLFKDEDDMIWYFSDIEKNLSSLDKNGAVLYSDIGSTYFIDLVKPDDVSLNDLYGNPKLAMDLILKGISLSRTVANQEIRVLSLGEPMSSETSTDAYGRKWMVNIWSIEYSNQAGIMYSAPTPDGMVCLLQFVSFGERYAWLYDLKKTLDFVYIPYIGTLEEWSEFLAQKDLLYGTFLDARLDYKPGAYLQMSTGEVDVELDAQLLEISDKSRLSLLHDFYVRESNIVWDIRKVVFSEEKKDNYFVVYRHIKPHPELPDRFKTDWETVVQKGHPYDEVSFTDDGRTNVGSIHPDNIAKSEDELQLKPWIHTIFLGKEGKVPEIKMTTSLNTLKKEIRVK